MFKVKNLVVKVLFLSGILVRSLSMKGFLVELKYSLVIYNPQSFQILSVEIVNSSMFKSRDYTK